MPKGSERPYTKKKVKAAQANRFIKKASSTSGMTSALYGAMAVDTLSGKRPAYKKTQKKK